MIALNFIDKEVFYLNQEVNINGALELMRKYELTELPYVENMIYKGMVLQSALLGFANLQENIPLSLILEKEPVDQQCHFFEIWSRLVESHLSCIAVVNDKHEFLGIIRKQSLLQFYKQSFALTEPGCIIVLTQRKFDYSLAKIASLVEEYDTVILSSFVTETSDPENILITIKLNRTDAELIVKSLQRHDIDVVDVFSEEAFGDLIKDRFNMLMSYLNL